MLLLACCSAVISVLSDYVGKLLLADRVLPIDYFEQWEIERDLDENVDSIINSANLTRCINNFRVSGQQFKFLLSLIEDDLDQTPKLSAKMQLSIFMDWISFNTTLRQQKERFKLSHDRILVARRQVKNAILRTLYPTYVQQIKHIPDLTQHPKRKYFQGAYGCLDGCHISIRAPKSQYGRWRNRKGFLSTNGLMICDLENMVFSFAIFGAEGCGSDSTVLRHSSREIDWLIDGFLLGDAGYGLSRKTLTPYRGVRYHLKEFHPSAGGRPTSKEELFNLRHASLRNIIERSFGILKKRFKILRDVVDVGSFDDMWSIMYCCVALHNFIRLNDSSVDSTLLEEYLREQNEGRQATEDFTFDTIDPELNDASLPEELKAWRDDIASAMWEDYINEQNQH